MAPEWNQRVIGEGRTIGPIRRSDAEKSFEQLPNSAFRQVTRDENQPRAVIIVGPAIKSNRRVKDVLHPVYDHGCVRHFGQLHDALQPQQFGAVRRTQQFQEHIECTSGDRFVRRQHERADVIVVTVDIMSVVMVFPGIGLLGQPFFYIRDLPVGVV